MNGKHMIDHIEVDVKGLVRGLKLVEELAGGTVVVCVKQEEVDAMKYVHSILHDIRHGVGVLDGILLTKRGTK